MIDEGKNDDLIYVTDMMFWIKLNIIYGIEAPRESHINLFSSETERKSTGT